MNPRRRALLVLLLADLLGQAHAREVVDLANGEWPPYLSQHLPNYGVVSRIITEAFALQGIEVRYGFFPWRRAIAMARAGDWNGTPVWIKSTERLQSFLLSDPIVQAECHFFHRRNMQFDWSTIEDLAPYRIGISNDYFYGEEFHDAIDKGLLTVESVPSDEQNFRKLLGERIDIFQIDGVAGRTLLRLRFSGADAEKIIIHRKPLYSEPMHLMLNKDKPENRQLMKEFNAGLRKLRASGRLDAFLKEVNRQRPAKDGR